MMAIAETGSVKDFLDLTSLRQFPEGTQQLLLRYEKEEDGYRLKQGKDA